MKVLVFIIFLAIASAVFYLFLKNLFEERSGKVKDTSGGEDEFKVLPAEGIKQENAFEGDSLAKEEPQEKRPAADTAQEAVEEESLEKEEEQH